MIIPIVDDATWIKKLGKLPLWTPPTKPTLVVSPHPDDEVLGVGGLIAMLRRQAVDVSIVAVTDGENAFQGSQKDRTALGRKRVVEQRKAAHELGVEPARIHRLHMDDSGLRFHEEELLTKLRALIRPGTHLIVPWIHDFHPDHEACARAAQTIAAELDLQITWYFFWTWHQGTLDLVKPLKLRRFVPDAAALQAKANALQCHHSQLEWATEEPILPERVLGPSRWPFEVFLPA